MMTRDADKKRGQMLMFCMDDMMVLCQDLVQVKMRFSSS